MKIEGLFSLGGIVIIPLVGFSLLALALILERLNFWLRVQKRSEKAVRQFFALYHRDHASALKKLEGNDDLPIVRIFLAALELNDPTPTEFKLALETAAQAELPLLRRFSTVLETIISVAPLLGLLGTILGLIESFSALKIGDLGATNTTGVSGGISEALISTAVGLVVAITTLLFANMFRGLYRRQLSLIQKYGGKLELLHARRSEFK